MAKKTTKNPKGAGRKKKPASVKKQSVTVRAEGWIVDLAKLNNINFSDVFRRSLLNALGLEDKAAFDRERQQARHGETEDDLKDKGGDT
jgi:hypothetical protein